MESFDIFKDSHVLTNNKDPLIVASTCEDYIEQQPLAPDKLMKSSESVTSHGEIVNNSAYISFPLLSNESSEASLQILQFNPDYIVSLSTNVTALVSPQKSHQERSYVPVTKDLDVKTSRLYKSKLSRAHRVRKPYDLPWRHSLERKHLSFDEQCPNYNWISDDNPSTSGIQRSRSLNEMDFVKWMLEERKNRVSREKKDLEMVSRHMQDLHVI